MGVRPDLGRVAEGASERPTGRVHRRLLAVCYVGGEDLNEWLVRKGWALGFRRYSTDYVQAETAAKRAGAGIWRGEFEPP
jgi:endonuclease YncB( thermonuclease family)